MGTCRRIVSGPVQVTAGYVVISFIWIFLSSLSIGRLFSDTAMVVHLEVIKGCFFVALTAGLLYIILQKREREALRQSEEAAAIHEEIIAAEEELRQQFDELLNKETKISRQNECLNALHEAALALMQEQGFDDVLATIVKKMMAISGS